MVLNRRPERQRSGRGSAADVVQEDVLREETRQLNVALAGGTAPATEGCCGAGGDFGAGMDRPGCALLLCKCRCIGLYLCSKLSQPATAPHGPIYLRRFPGIMLRSRLSSPNPCYSNCEVFYARRDGARGTPEEGHARDKRGMTWALTR